ncbi:hypothetical protein JCM11491_003657 [Sporobolomyces phaffii]
MKIPALPAVDDTFDSIELAEERLLASTFPLTGFGLRKLLGGSSSMVFHCMSGRGKKDKGTVPECGFKVVVTGDATSRRCTISQVDAEHNHAKSPKLEADPDYVPSSQVQGTLAKVMKRLRADDKTTSKRQREEESILGDGSNDARKTAKVDHDHHEGADAGSETRSLEAFLRSLSAVFDLGEHAHLLRASDIGISTPEQLVDIAGSNLDGLLDKLSGKLGFGPSEALRKALKKETSE